MSWTEQYAVLARYNAWMNAKLYRAVADMSDAERKRDRGAFFRSVHGTLNHLLLADGIWLFRLSNDVSVKPHDGDGRVIAISGLDQVLYDDFDDLRRERERLDDVIGSWVARLDDVALSSSVTYQTTAGASQTLSLWQIASHLFNHQAHHRGQITTLLSQQGIDVGSTDLSALLREEAKRP